MMFLVFLFVLQSPYYTPPPLLFLLLLYHHHCTFVVDTTTHHITLSLHPSSPSPSSSTHQLAPSHLHCAHIYAAPAAMDCLQATTAYINKIISNTSGIKVLLLDAETVRPPHSPHICTNTLADGRTIARVDSIDAPLA